MGLIAEQLDQAAAAIGVDEDLKSTKPDVCYHLVAHVAP